jgi:flagellar M-ring protein FliF
MSKGGRMALLLSFIAALAIGGFFAFHHAEPTYAPLFTNLDRDDAAGVVTKLKEMKVPYKVEGDGSIIEVPEDKARELRLDLAGQGLPRGGNVGFESFDKMRLGATEFEQRIQYRRALEGELSRTIGTIGAVENARIHLVLPEKSVFVSKNEPSSASVVLKLRGGRALGPAEVTGIVHLVSSSVSGLTPDRVAVVTTEGTVLHKPRRPGEDSTGDSGSDGESHARALEAALEERARAMVEKVTGPGHTDVRVTADLDQARVEHVEDHYDPAKTALRSEESNLERTPGTEDVPVAGVPGAESNLPNGSATKGGGADAGAAEPPGKASAVALPTRESHTRNFEVDHVSEKRVVAGGVLRRMTVAVVLDGNRSKEDLDKIAGLVRSAVGFDARRGDVVTVEAVPFLVAEEPKVAPPPPLKLPYGLENPKKYGPIAGGLLALLVLALYLKVRSSRKKRAVSQALALAAAKEEASAEQVTVEILGKDKEEEGDATSPDVLKQMVRERAQLDPATAALIVRGWLGNVEATREEAA